MTITAREIAEEVLKLRPEDVSHPALKRLVERARAEPVVLGIYSRMHHRHNRSPLPKTKEELRTF